LRLSVDEFEAELAGSLGIQAELMELDREAVASALGSTVRGLVVNRTGNPGGRIN
jgi:hypothetical protein